MSFTTYNRVEIPSIMYGTAWKKEETARLTTLAVKAGFRAIDSANFMKHYNEPLVGLALQAILKEGMKRDEFFLQTKFTSVDSQDHRLPYDPKAALTDQVKQSVESSLKHFDSDYLDSYIYHGPDLRHGLTAGDWEIWTAIEELHKSGKLRVVGVSNFAADQLSLLCAKASIKPMIVQNRCYAAMGWDKDVRKVCRENSIVYQGFSLLTANSRELHTQAIHSIAERVKATIPQVIFKFAMSVGMLPLTGTSNEQHMKEDLVSEQLNLTDDEISTIENISKQGAGHRLW